MKTIDKTKCIEACNSLLRGEISAVEAYEKALEKFAGESNAAILEDIRLEHEKSVAELQRRVVSMGGTPDERSGIWGDFAIAVQSAANLFGKGSATESLMRGEEHGRRVYLEAVEDGNVFPECKLEIQALQLPRIDRHIATLEAVQKEVA